MALRKGYAVVVLVGVALTIGACKPPEPQPSHYADLGDGDYHLLPTPTAWHYPAVAKGQADWKPFRKPGEVATAGAGSTPPGEAALTESGSAPDTAAIEKEIHELVVEYNRLVGEGSMTDALDYLTEANAALAEKYVRAWTLFEQKLKELIEISPGLSERAAKVLDIIGPKKMLSVGVNDLKVAGANEVTGDFVDPTTGNAPPEGQEMVVRFIREDGGDWFIESKLFDSVGLLATTISEWTDSIGPLVDAIKAKSLSESELEDAIKQINSNFDRVTSAAPGEGLPDSGSASTEEAETEAPAAEEPPPQPKKPPPRGG